MQARDDLYTSFMLDHASGALNVELMLAGELHARLNERGKQAEELWASVGGAMLELIDDRPASGTAARGHRSGLRAAGRAPAIDELADELCGSLDHIRWRPAIFGFDIPARRQNRVGRLMRLRPGRSVPAHGHDRFEATVILSGAFGDGHGVYGRGDIVFSTPGLRHKPEAASDEGCICYVARATERTKTWRG